MDEGDHFDQARLLAEIEEDARGSRREGIVIPAFQRQLDALFDRLSQPATSDDLEQVVTSAEELAIVNADMPAASNFVGGGVAKKGRGGPPTDRSLRHRRR